MANKNPIDDIFKGFTWSKPNWNSIFESLQLRKSGADDGHQNIPTKEEVEISDTENRIGNKYKESLQKDDDNLSQRLGKLENLYSKDDQSIEATTFNNVSDHAKHECDTLSSNLSKDIQGSIKDEHVEKFSLKNFKIINKLLTRTANYKLRSWCIFGVLVFILLESLVNANFLGAFMEDAMRQAIPITIGIAAINVGFSYIIGNLALRQLWHLDLKNKIIGALFCIVWVCAIIWINGNFANFRSALSSLQAAGVHNAEIYSLASEKGISDIGFPPSFKDRTITHTVQKKEMDPSTGFLNPVGEPKEETILIKFDFDSRLLLALGLLFAVLGLLDGFFSDDPYPGYGKKTRLYLYHRRKNKEKFDNCAKNIEKILGSALGNLNMKYDEGYNVGKLKLNIINKLETIFKGREIIVSECEEQINIALKTYRTANKQGREEKPPKYFEEKYKLSEDEKDVAKKFRDIYEDFGDYLYSKKRKHGLAKHINSELINFKNNNVKKINEQKIKMDNFISKLFKSWLGEGKDDDFDPPGGAVVKPPKIKTEKISEQTKQASRINIEDSDDNRPRIN